MLNEDDNDQTRQPVKAWAFAAAAGIALWAILIWAGIRVIRWLT